MKKYFRLLRINHYFKNFLVFVPLFFSGKYLEMQKLLHCWGGVLAFCVLSSAVYIINDLKDIEKDRIHSTKRNRPLASGEISSNTAVVLAIILLIFGITCVFFLSGWKINKSVLIYIFYFLINIGYSVFGMKNIPILDITILAAGFLLRVLFGAALCNITISGWLYLTVIMIAFFMGFGKRRNEIIFEDSIKTRDVLVYYNKGFLDKNMYMFLGIAIVFYSLWTIDSITIENYGTDKLIYTVPLIVVMCMRYSFMIEGNSSGDPIEILTKDKVLIVLSILYIIIIICLRFFIL